MDAVPGNFPMNPGHSSHHREDPLLCFYLDSVSRWPDHIERLGLVQNWRDQDLTPDEESFVDYAGAIPNDTTIT